MCLYNQPHNNLLTIYKANLQKLDKETNNAKKLVTELLLSDDFSRSAGSVLSTISATSSRTQRNKARPVQAKLKKAIKKLMFMMYYAKSIETIVLRMLSFTFLSRFWVFILCIFRLLGLLCYLFGSSRMLSRLLMR